MAPILQMRAVPQSMLYDNTKLAVARIPGDGKRKLTRVFSEVMSHYLFDTRFGRPGKGNDKRKVESLVGYVLFVPPPSFESFDRLRTHRTGQPVEGSFIKGYIGYKHLGQVMLMFSDSVLPNWSAKMSSHGRSDIDAEGADETSGAQQRSGRSGAGMSGGRGPGSERTPHEAYSGGL